MRKEETVDVSKFFILAVVVVLLFVGMIVVFSGVYTISAGERGVLLTWGKPSMEAIDEGLHFKFPVAQTVKKMEVRTQKLQTTASAASRDLQDVQTAIALNFHVNPSDVPRLYQEVGTHYIDRVIAPSIQETVKAVQADFTAEELVTKRPEVKRQIQERLTERLSKYYIVIDDFNIENFQFSASFNAAIEAKQVAEQEALKAERELDRIKVEAEQEVTKAQADKQSKILRAEGEAESIRIQSSALQQNKDILQLRWIEKWSGTLPQYMGGDATPLLNLNSGQ